MKNNKLLIASLTACLLLSVSIVVAFALNRDRPLGESYKEASEYGGEFTLKNSTGEVSLSDFKGKVVVLYFGYTQCKMACPISLMKLKTALSRMSKEELDNLQTIFISIDPERDKPKALEVFTKNYHKNIIGLVDTPESIKKLIKQYGAYIDKASLEGESSTYTVDHSSRFYLVGRDGKIVTTMSHSTTPAELAARLKKLMSEGK